LLGKINDLKSKNEGIIISQGLCVTFDRGDELLGFATIIKQLDYFTLPNETTFK